MSLQTLMNKRSLDDREILDVISPLASACTCPQPHPSSPLLQILSSTCNALVHLHSQTPPIAHRDIKVLDPLLPPLHIPSQPPPTT